MCVWVKRYYGKHFSCHSALRPLLCKFMQWLHIHQDWPICHLTGERCSFSAKPVWANLMYYLGTHHILPSSAELQLQSLKSIAWAANCPYFTTALQYPLHKPLPTFSAVGKLLAAFSHTSQLSSSVTLRQRWLHYKSLTSTFVIPFLNAQLKSAFSLFFNSFFGVRQPTSDCAALWMSLSIDHWRCSRHERSHHQNSLSLIRHPFAPML